MEEIKLETKLEEKGIDLRCRDSCPCHCKYLDLDNGYLPSVEYFK